MRVGGPGKSWVGRWRERAPLLRFLQPDLPQPLSELPAIIRSHVMVACTLSPVGPDLVVADGRVAVALIRAAMPVPRYTKGPDW